MSTLRYVGFAKMPAYNANSSQEGITDYPLISKEKSSKSFRELLVGFFRSLVTILHETDVLYTDSALMENIARWVASMSSSTLRPFRHTATTVALSMEAALVEVAKTLDARISKIAAQVDAEKNRKGKNKERLAEFQKSLTQAEQYRQICQDQITDFFETVFVHRYRDIDAKIRTECVEALGTWIWTLPDFFMEPEYLRYLGWMLSDIVPQTRLEVLKQLARILKRDASKLGHFIDRFRPRLVEMATKDADVNVRVAAVSVMQILKGSGMLEPDEIDSVGRLIFDSELRIRKATVEFFAGCVNDLIESKVEDLGGDDAIDEMLGEDPGDDYLSPRREWIMVKCLAELLAAYDAQLEEENKTQSPRGLDIAVEMVQAAPPETRISMASQVLFEYVEEVKKWELLAGYLLYDHTTSTKSKSSSSKKVSSEEALKNAMAPEGKEETVLLEVLVTSVRLSLASGKQRGDGGDDDTVVHLANIMPRLLSKYGAEASTAVLVLRLSHSLPLDVFQQLRQDATTFKRLLGDISSQFVRHVDRGVIAEATAALLHARKYDELRETTDEEIANLWENFVNALRNIDKQRDLGVRANMTLSGITQFGNVLLKLSKLASIADCVDILEAESTNDDSQRPLIELLIKAVHRGKLDQVDEELDDLEDEAVSYAVQASHFYFMWKVRSLISSINTRAEITALTIEQLAILRKSFANNLIWTLSSRGTNDELRLFATGALCDLHVLFATLREAAQPKNQSSTNPSLPPREYPTLAQLFDPIPQALIPELIEIYSAAERAYARAIGRDLNKPSPDELAPSDPNALPLGDDGAEVEVNLEGEDADLSDVDDLNQLTPTERKARELKLERALCELAGKYVLAILAGVLDNKGGRLRRRMLRNRNKLGANLRETVAFLEMDEGRLRERVLAGEGKGKKGTSGKKSAGKTAAGSSKPAASGSKKGKGPLSEEVIIEGDSNSELSELSEPEDIVEDMDDPQEESSRRRQGDLVDDPIDEDEEQDGGGSSKKDKGKGKEKIVDADRMDEDSVLGD